MSVTKLSRCQLPSSSSRGKDPGQAAATKMMRLLQMVPPRVSHTCPAATQRLAAGLCW
jgi:hypothetical protein